MAGSKGTKKGRSPGGRSRSGYSGRKSGNAKKRDGEGVKKRVLDEKNYVEAGSAEEKEYLSKLAREVFKADEDCISYVQTSKAVKDKDEARKHMDGMTVYYNRRMMLACAEPLTQGIKKDSVIQAVGMYAGMCLFNKDFAGECHRSVTGALLPYVEKKAASAGPDSKWAKRRDAIIAEQHNGRLPMDAKSASIQYIGLTKRAYSDMRRLGADVSKVMADYKEACGYLYDFAEADGIDATELNENVRTVIGQMVEHDPAQAQFFSELAFGDVVQAEGRVGKDGAVYWHGEFADKDGKPFGDAFLPRMPMDEAAHADVFSQFVRSEFSKCSTYADFKSRMESADYRRQSDMYVSMMLSDGFDASVVNDSFSPVLKAAVSDWFDTHPEGAKAAYAQRQARQSENTTRRTPDVDFGQDVHDSGYDFMQVQ